MKVYIVLEDYDNGERWPEDHEEMHEVFRGCFSDREKAWSHMDVLAENAYKNFERNYCELQSYYSKPTITKNDRYLIRVGMRYPSTWADQEECYHFRLVEMEV